MYNEVESLPEGFDGVFRFTNFTDDDFVTMWDSKEYRFPKKSTVPLIIPTETPQAIQNIRRKFAKRLALREWYAGKQYQEFNDLTKQSGGVPMSIDPMREDSLLAPFVQRCLEPMAVASVIITKAKKNPVKVSDATKVIGETESLKAGSSDASGDLESLPIGE